MPHLLQIVCHARVLCHMCQLKSLPRPLPEKRGLSLKKKNNEWAQLHTAQNEGTIKNAANIFRQKLQYISNQDVLM